MKPPLSTEQRKELIRIARDSIRHGLEHGQPLPVERDALPPELAVPRATFVTLEENGQLRGCIGHLEPDYPLAEDISRNAFAAAFQDPRFPPVSASEVDRLDIHLSILSPFEDVSFSSQDDLLKKIRPGVDGLVLQDGFRRGLFLPSVWESLPTPRAFLDHLKMKAGFSPDYWSPTVRIQRFTADVIKEED